MDRKSCPWCAPVPRLVRGSLAALLLVAYLLATGTATSSLAQADGALREVTVQASGQAALIQPMVTFQLRDPRSGKRLAVSDDGLEDLLGGVAPLAILDTGASAHVVSPATAERYGIGPEPGARYVEVGMTGEVAMAVSRPYNLALWSDDARAGTSPLPAGRSRELDRPKEQGREANRERSLVFTLQRFLLNDAGGDLLTLLSSPGAGVDVVGMPAIGEMVVEIEPAQSTHASLPVCLRPKGSRVDAEFWIPFEMANFNRPHHPHNRGALPSLARNPVVRGVRAVAGKNAASGAWLFDTGSAVTVLSTAGAKALGLLDGHGRPVRQPDFTLPIGGISGVEKALPGFRLDRLEIPAERDTVLVIATAPVVVHDVATTRDDGTATVLDGVLGMNLFLAAGSDPELLGFAREHAPTFARIVIDAGRGRLGLTPRR
jgi:hypothetical protein